MWYTGTLYSFENNPQDLSSFDTNNSDDNRNGDGLKQFKQMNLQQLRCLSSIPKDLKGDVAASDMIKCSNFLLITVVYNKIPLTTLQYTTIQYNHNTKQYIILGR